MKTEVSVIMGVSPASSDTILLEAVESILTQTKQEWELIICNDGASVSCTDLLKQLEQKDKRIHLIENRKNKGLAYSLNRCMEIARGKYIARMDADDKSHKERLEREVTYLEDHPQVALVGCSSWLFDEKEIWGIRRMKKEPERKDFLWGNPFMHPTVCIRRAILEKAGGYLVSKETRRLEDYELFMRIYELGYSGENLIEPYYYFREDKEAVKRKKYRFRIDEVKIRYRGFQRLGLLPKGTFYIFKPLLVGVIPYPVLRKLRKEEMHGSIRMENLFEHLK